MDEILVKKDYLNHSYISYKEIKETSILGGLLVCILYPFLYVEK
ncbi:hypothetical protein EMIT040CA3_40118 [Bacillus pseudomycoides]